MSCLDEREVWNLAPYVARDLSCHVMSRRARGVELSAVCGSGFLHPGSGGPYQGPDQPDVPVPKRPEGCSFRQVLHSAPG